MKKITLSLALIAFLGTGFAQDFKVPAPSPSTTILQDFSTSTVELKYSRPSVKDRRVFGEMIPYGQLWRTGANSITTIKFNEEFSFGDVLVKPGTYALVAIPNKDEWVILLHSNTKAWGVGDLTDDGFVAKVGARVLYSENLQETFEISFQNMRDDSMDLVLAWEHSKVVVPIKVDNFERILKHFQKELAGKNPPHFNAARFYLAHNHDLEGALKLMDLAIKNNPQAYYMHWTRAQILDKLGKKGEAINAAEMALKGATGTAYEAEYKHHLESLKSK